MNQPNRQTRLKRVKKQLYVLASKVRREMDGKCEMCGSTENLQAHHWLYPRAHSLALAFCLDNLSTLCYVCHIIKIHQRAEGHFIKDFLERMSSKVGNESVDRMKARARESSTITLEELEELRDKFLLLTKRS